MCESNTPDRGITELAMPIVPSEVPLARPITPVGLTPNPDPAVPGPPTPGPFPEPGPGLPELEPVLEPISPKIQLCRLDFRDGCYAMTINRTGAIRPRYGTLRVDRAAPDAGSDGLIVSGDVYNAPLPVFDPITHIFPEGLPTATIAAGHTRTELTTSASAAMHASLSEVATTSLIGKLRPRIPIYPRSRYHSYLKGTRLSVPRFSLVGRGCRVTIDLDEFEYTQPPVGQHKGSFPSSPSRSVRFVLDQLPTPFPFSIFGGPHFTGRLIEGGVDRGSVSLTWVSRFLRRAVLEIDTLAGAVAPQPVPHPSGTGTEYFDTVYAQAGWDLDVQEDQTGVPVPAGVNATACWSSADLHALMLSVRSATTNLDAEWRTHLIVVPARLGCSRGVMYDQIDVPREGSASFSDDGYPTSDSSNFGAAANQTQRTVPRAFLRSATHEVTHAFNQIHQEQETSADNSIMTTTPSVADVLGGPTTGAPGVFPDQIALALNSTVRNHLAHMPDPVVRPGGWPFGSWFGTPTPQASDRAAFTDDELSVTVTVDDAQPAFGAPVTVRWEMTNTSDQDLHVPNDVSLDALFATMSVTDDRGRVRPVRPFVIRCEAAKLETLAPGESHSAEHRLFWSSDGFALDRPGHHTVTVSVQWSAGGVPVTADGSADVWVDYPVNSQENADAALVMHPEVGKWVALDGGAYHLTEAVDRLSALAGGSGAGDSARGVAGPSRLAAAFSDLMPSGAADARRAPARKATARKPAAKKTAAKKTAAKKTAPKRTR